MKLLLPFLVCLAACGAHEPQPDRPETDDDQHITRPAKPQAPNGGPLIQCCMPPEYIPPGTKTRP